MHGPDRHAGYPDPHGLERLESVARGRSHAQAAEDPVMHALHTHAALDVRQFDESASTGRRQESGNQTGGADTVEDPRSIFRWWWAQQVAEVETVPSIPPGNDFFFRGLPANDCAGNPLVKQHAAAQIAQASQPGGCCATCAEPPERLTSLATR